VSIATITLWLLVSVGYEQTTNQNSGRSTQIVERFASKDECDRVLKILRDVRFSPRNDPTNSLLCVQATVYKP